MIVVTDTAPLNYLVIIGHADILPVLFGSVVIPHAVAEEMRRPRTPEIVRAWIAAPPPWCTFQSPQGADPSLDYLGDGERAALLLYQELSANAILMDDEEAVDEARNRGMEVVRTLALLERASLEGLIDLRTAIARLLETTFYAPRRIIDEMLARHTRNQPRPEP